MNYEPNTIQWTRGDIVIHAADAKEPKMLMKIIGFTRDGLAKCQYVDTRHKRTVYPNPISVLHDPTRFGLQPVWGRMAQSHLARCQEDFERVRYWNQSYAIGQTIRTTSADGGFETTTMSKAYMRGDAGYLFLARWPVTPLP